MDDARDIIDQTVLVKLANTDGIEFAGIEGDGPFFCRVIAVDEVGMWVENRHFLTVEIRDKDGKDIPVDRRKKESNTVNFLLPWRNVLTVVRFPDKDQDEFANETLGVNAEEPGRIGFIK